MAKEITKDVTNENGEQIVKTVAKAPLSTKKKVAIGAGIALGIGAAVALVKAIFSGGEETDTSHDFCTADSEDYAEEEEPETEEE